MDTTEITYPVFEANQVLSPSHLNDLFEYLDEQNRLTRANLIGIGIVCGLNVTLEAPGTVHLSKGCGVTSEGYLIIEPADVALTHVRAYTLPVEYGYPPFVDVDVVPALQYDLWELFADDDEPGSVPLAGGDLVLEDKAVVLLLELRRDALRNCSPNNCDDRGAEVTAIVRRLLIDVSDLDKVIAAASALAPTYLGADLTERLQLPDLRMPRFDVPSTTPVGPEEVLFAFQQVFRQNKLAAETGAALTALYDAFKPVVVEQFPTNPFATFMNRFGFLDASPATTAQVRFIQYYWDLFDDLLAAYDEVRWTGLELIGACCPPAGLFPRHLMAGVLDPASYDAADYRHHFVPSPALGDSKDRARDFRILFRRLVEMLTSFTDAPSDRGTRATPSRWGAAALSSKAIPYYYEQDGAPPLFELWDPLKTTRRRANLNLGYRSDEYPPPVPAFVTDPLRFDLEPNDFLRIEGHLGKNVQRVLESLLALRKTHRLPIEVIALRTGAFDESIEIDLRTESCHFRDLEMLYDALKSELTCFLAKQTEYFYSLPAPAIAAEEPVTPTIRLLRDFSPHFVAQPGTVGRRIEGVLTWRPGQPRPLSFAVAGIPDLPGQVLALIGAMSELSARLTDDFRTIDFPAFADRYEHLVEIARRTEELRRSGAFDAPGLADRLDDLVFRCSLDPFEALAEEYRRRIRQVKQAQFLSHFLERHPGVQHKAGVPLGGTFILVYHELDRPVPTPRLEREQPVTDFSDGLRPAIRPDDVRGDFVRREFGRPALSEALGLDEGSAERLQNAFSRFQYKTQLAEDPDLQLVYKLFTGNVLVPRFATSNAVAEVYRDAIAKLEDGTVIADFFLPYAHCSDCPPIQYQLPPSRLRVSTSKGCTNSDGLAEVTLTTEGGSGSLSVAVDGGAFQELVGPLLLSAGDHTVVVRDAAGSESAPVEVTIPPQLLMNAAPPIVDAGAATYHVVATVVGGTPPYAVDPGTIVDATYTSPAVPLGERLTVQVTDAAGCTVQMTFVSDVEPCELPCDGAAQRHGYRFWLPEARPSSPINEYRAQVSAFVVTDHDGNAIDLTAEVERIINQAPASIRTDDFGRVVERWLTGINRLVAEKVGSDQWLRMEYEPSPETGTNGDLYIDRIVCVGFAFDLAVQFMQHRRERAFEFSYSSKSGTSVVDRTAGAEYLIPPFGGSTSNKCRAGDPPVPLCEGTDLELLIKRDGAFPDLVELVAAVSGGDQPIAFLWEVQDGVPPVAGGERIILQFEPPEPVEKLVRLTAFTEKGCTVTIEQVIDITKRDG